jgi:hypothetical protein
MDPETQTAVAASVATEGEGAPLSGVPAENASPETEAPQVNWDADDNPWKSRATEYETKAQVAARLEQENAQYRQLFAQAAQQAEQEQRKRLKTQFQNAEIDSETYDAEMNKLIAQRDQYWQQQMTPYWTRDFADQVAQANGLTADERRELDGLDGRAIEFAAQQIVKRRELVPANRVAELEAKLEQIQRSMAAGQVVNSGATRTLAANPTGGVQQEQTPTQKLRSFLQSTHPDLYTRFGGG